MHKKAYFQENNTPIILPPFSNIWTINQNLYFEREEKKEDRKEVVHKINDSWRKKKGMATAVVSYG